MSSSSNGNHSDAASGANFLDEVIADYIRACEAGQPPDRDELLAKHTDLADELREFFANRDQMDQVALPMRILAARVLNVRCPHCHNPIELLDRAPLADISCPSCGSSFSLVGDKTEAQYPAGSKTIGHFELLEHVGIGAFGSVWKARDTKLDRTVAIKFPRRGQLDESETEMFLRDARAAAQLKHPNIVGVHEVGKQNGTIYIVSDFIKGITLRECVAAKPPTPREAAELCIKIAKALHHAHESGVIHRDLKPGNIMMNTDGEPHIVDFGLAKREAGEITMTVEGQILGTPAYMSPEQARGEGHTVDRRADIYSLGVILFELLTGELPFRGEKQMLIVQILNDDPPNPRKLNSSVPRDLETICLKCLGKDGNRRYECASDLADDLGRWLDGQPIVARRSGPLERTVKWARRKPAAAALVIMTSICATMLITWLIASNVSTKSILEARTKEAEANKQLAENKTDLADKERRMRGEESRRRKESEREAARLHFEQSFAKCQYGDPAVGLLWSAGSLERAIKVGDAELEQSIRLQLGGRSLFIPRLRLVVENAGSGVAFGPDSKTVFIPRRSQQAEFRNIMTGRVVGPRIDTKGRVICAVFSRDGKKLVTGGQNNAVQAWDTETGEQLGPSIQTRGTTMSLWLSSDGTTLLTADSRDHIELWDLRTGELIREAARYLTETSWPQVGISADGKTVLTPGKLDGNVAKLWNVDTGEEIRSFPSRFESEFADIAALTPDGTRAVISSNVVRIFDISTGQLLVPPIVAEDGPLSSIAISSDSKYLLTGGDAVRIWDTHTGKPIGWPLLHYAESVHFSLDGKWMLTVGDSARLWECPIQLSEGRPVEALSRFPTHVEIPSSIKTSRVWEHAVSADRAKAITGPYEGTAQIWDGRSGTPIGPPLEHMGGVDVALSPDGNIALTGDAGAARFWGASSGKLLGAPLQHEGPVTVAFGADGKNAFTTPAAGGGYRSWRVPQHIPGDPGRVTLWTQVITGMEIDEFGHSRLLTPSVWRQRRDQLEALGGSLLD